MLQEIHRKIIHFAIDLDIGSVNMYAGYKGDSILKIITKSKSVVLKIREYSLASGINDVVVKERLDPQQFEIYCIAKDEELYKLHKVGDIWDSEEYL